jgi:serine/threonine-protein kinase
MDADNDLQLLMLALRDRVLDPVRLAEVAGEWPRDGTGLMDFLAGRGAIAADQLRRLEGETADVPAAVRDGDPSQQTTPSRGDKDATTDYAADGDTPADAAEPRGNAGPSARYANIRLHQTGGLGQVWLARDTAVGREVALKTIRPDRAAGAGARARFLREARVTGQLEHPCIVPLYDLQGGAEPFYVMRFVTGRALAEASADYHRRRSEGRAGPLDLNTLLDAFVGVCRAVAFAHARDVLHRDLKGQNVVVGEYGEVFLLDWGLAKSVGAPDDRPPDPAADDGEPELTAAGSFVGTPAYLAPEVAAGGSATKASDVYGLGAILYALLSGRPPYAGSTPEILKKVAANDPEPVSTANPSAPPALVAVCHKAMARCPAGRYRSADELATEVRRWLADEPVDAYREPFAARAARWARRRKTAVVAAAVLLLTATVATATAATLVWREQQQTKRAWEKADEEKAKAVENADTAIEVVRDMSTYAESYEMGLGIVGPTQQQREARLEKALGSYERLLALHPDEPFVRWNVARMHRFRANLGRFLNSTDEAERSYQESVRLLNQLAADFPEKPEYQDLRALCLRDYGLFLHRIGRHAESRRLVADAERLYEEMLQANPNNGHYQRFLGYMMIVRSDREYQAGRMAEAEQSARRAMRLYEQAARDRNTLPEPLDPLFHAMATQNLAMALHEKDAKEAIKYHDMAYRECAYFGNTTGSRDGKSYAHQILTEHQWFASQYPDKVGFAITNLQMAIKAWGDLITGLGTTPIDQKRKAVASMYLARIRLASGKRDEATKDLEAAVVALERLVAGEPRMSEYRYELGRVYTTRGQTAATPREAAEWYGRAREMLDASIAQYPENVHYKRALAELDAALKAKQ